MLSTQPGEDGVQLVSSFVEKPEPELARRLMASGALWNSFNFTASVSGLMARLRRALPWLTECFELLASGQHQERRNTLLPRFYDRLPHVDFARRVLEHSQGRFHVLPVPPCGWARSASAGGAACTRKTVTRGTASSSMRPLSISRAWLPVSIASTP
jgi:mannose-1-phosphate guanylyltransferase